MRQSPTRSLPRPASSSGIPTNRRWITAAAFPASHMILRSIAAPTAESSDASCVSAWDLFRLGGVWDMPGFPRLELTRKIFLTRLKQLRHNFRALRCKPVLEFVKRFNGGKNRCRDLQSFTCHGRNGTLATASSKAGPPERFSCRPRSSNRELEKQLAPYSFSH